MDRLELEDLASGYLDGTLTEEQFRLFVDALRNDPEARRYLLDAAGVEVALRDLAPQAGVQTAKESYASRVSSPVSETESPEFQAAGQESTAVGHGSPSECPKPVTRKSGAVPIAAPDSDPAARDARLGTRDSVAPARGAVPDVHYGTGIHKFVKGKSSAQVGSSKRLRALRRQRPAALQRPLWPIYAAAGVMVAVSLWLALGRGGGLAHVAPPSAAQDPKTREAFENNRLAQEELARREASARQAREKAVRAQAARGKAQEQLAELERKKQELVGQASPPALPGPEGARAQAETEEARRQELARIEAQQLTEGERLAQAEAQARQAEEELARTEAAQKEAVRKLALAQRRAEELGRVVFVVELKRAEPRGTGVPPVSSFHGPVLVRGKGADAQRLPLAKDMAIHAGDRIETGASEESKIQNPKSKMPRSVHAALELSSGATVDLADGTNFEVTGAAEARLDAGLLFAEASGFSGGAAGNSQGAAAKKWVVQTPCAHAEVEQASFDLSVDSSQTVLQVMEGEAYFANETSRRKVEPLQRISALKNGNLVQKGVSPAELWGGRKGTLHLGLVCHWTFDERKGTLAADASGHGHRGTLTGAPVWTAGRLGGALQVDGSKDQVDYGSGAGLNFGAGGVFTFAGWVKTKDLFGPILSQRSGAEDSLKGAVIDLCVGFDGAVADAGKLMAFVRENGGLTLGYARVTGGVVNDDRWHHFTLTRNAAGQIELFLDGKSQGVHSGTHSAGAITTDLRSMGCEPVWVKIGYGTPEQRFLNGALDDVRVYDRILSAREIGTLAGQDGATAPEKK